MTGEAPFIRRSPRTRVVIEPGAAHAGSPGDGSPSASRGIRVSTLLYRHDLLHLRLYLRHPRGGNAGQRGDFTEREVRLQAKPVHHQFERFGPRAVEHRFFGNAVLASHLPQD